MYRYRLYMLGEVVPEDDFHSEKNSTISISPPTLIGENSICVRGNHYCATRALIILQYKGSSLETQLCTCTSRVRGH